MLDHVTLNVRNVQRSKGFYEQALRPLGYSAVAEWDHGAGFGTGEGGPDFWIVERGDVSAPVHVALRAGDHESVDAFHRAGLEAGGLDNGAPGIRPDYHERYYGAYVLDPDGNNIEAVFHGA
jgi:catechol 2,3-dioxygenase-like lactoylglutathione lyase family enzyme